MSQEAPPVRKNARGSITYPAGVLLTARVLGDESISEDIEQRATAKYLDQKKELDRKFKAQTASYDSFLLGLLLYGVLTTVFTAVRSEAFVSDFKTFFMVIWQFIVNAFQLLLKGGQWASQLGDKIPQPVVATIVHYIFPKTLLIRLAVKRSKGQYII